MSGLWRLVILCVILVASGPSAVADPGPDIAHLYIDAGHDALGAGDHADAETLARLALEFHDASDAWYLLALAGSRQALPAAQLIGWTERALSRDNWYRSDPLAAVVLLMRLANRVGDYARTMELAQRFARDPATEDDVLRRYYLEYARALFVVAGDERLDGLLVRARDRFPDEPRLFLFDLAREPFPSRSYRREIERLAAVASDWLAVGELIYVYSLRAPTVEERQWAVEELLAGDWRDPAIAIPVAADDATRAVELYLSRDGFRDQATLGELLVRIPDGDQARTRLLDAASAYTGVSLYDPDRDGFWSERLTVDSGVVTRWERDLDQDGVVEVELLLAAGEPALLVRRDGVQRVEFEYEQYPFVGSVLVALDDGEERYRVRPRAMRLESVVALDSDGALFGSPFALLPNVRTVTRRELRGVAVQIDLVDSAGRIVEQSFQQGGPMTRIQRDENGDGEWDHLVLTNGGFALSGVRDIDGDGYFEVAEGYRNGSLVALAVDGDDDGIPEVFERNVGVPVREWDLNEDGAIDVREFSYWTDAVVREFPLAGREVR